MLNVKQYLEAHSVPPPTPDRYDMMRMGRSWARFALYAAAALIAVADIMFLYDAIIPAYILLFAGSFFAKSAFFSLSRWYRAFTRDFEIASRRAQEEFGLPARTFRFSYFLTQPDLREASRRHVQRIEGDLRMLRRNAQRLEVLMQRKEKRGRIVQELLRELDELSGRMTERESRSFHSACQSNATFGELHALMHNIRCAVMSREKGMKVRKGERRIAPRAPVAVAEPVAEARSAAEEVFIQLPEIERSWDIDALLPDTVDKPMAKAIILELMDLGNRKKAFGESYRAEDRLKRMVNRRYGRTQRFRPKVFSKTLRALVDAGVLETKPKTDEEVFSLCPRPNNAADARSAELIREIVRFYSRISTPG